MDGVATTHYSEVTLADLLTVRDLVTAHFLPYGAKIILFGSFARGDADRASDIDVAVDAPGGLPVELFAELSEKLEASSILRTVDLIDLRNADASLRQRVKSEGIVWQP